MTWGSSRNNEQQVEQLSKEIQIFQNNVLNKMQEIAKSIERDRGRIYEATMSVSRIESELRQVHKLVDTLIIHLITPDFPLQKIKEAMKEVKGYHDNLQEKQQSLDVLHQTFTTGISQVLTDFSKIASSARNTDSHLSSIEISPPDGKEASTDHVVES